MNSIERECKTRRVGGWSGELIFHLAVADDVVACDVPQLGPLVALDYHLAASKSPFQTTVFIVIRARGFSRKDSGKSLQSAHSHPADSSRYLDIRHDVCHSEIGEHVPHAVFQNKRSKNNRNTRAGRAASQLIRCEFFSFIAFLLFLCFFFFAWSVLGKQAPRSSTKRTRAEDDEFVEW